MKRVVLVLSTLVLIFILSPVVSDHAAAQVGTEKWAFNIGGYGGPSPAIGSDGTIYVKNSSGRLYAINPDGTEKWTFYLAGYGSLVGQLAIGSHGTIYVSSDTQRLHAIKPNGTQRWAFFTGGFVASSPAIGSDETIYVGGEGGTGNFGLLAINPDGTVKWVYYTNHHVTSSPAIDSDGTIYVGSFRQTSYWAYGGILKAINLDGTGKWTFTVGGADDISSSPAIGSDGTIYVCSFRPISDYWSGDCKLHAIYGDSGGLARSPWPMFRHDVEHTGNVSGEFKEKATPWIPLLLLDD